MRRPIHSRSSPTLATTVSRPGPRTRANAGASRAPPRPPARSTNRRAGRPDAGMRRAVEFSPAARRTQAPRLEGGLVTVLDRVSRPHAGFILLGLADEAKRRLRWPTHGRR